jgi:RNA polymerase sigma-70 factor (ECF subfamily)
VIIATANGPDELRVTHADAKVSVATREHADPALIERVYADHYRDVFRYALAMTRSVEEAEEVTSDTFERALRTWTDTPVRPVAWLLLTARRIATDRWRRARRLARIVMTAQSSQRPSLAEYDPEFDDWFGALAKVLTERQREVLILRYQRDLADTDIGAVMGLSESGVRSLVARALAELRAHPELL